VCRCGVLLWCAVSPTSSCVCDSFAGLLAARYPECLLQHSEGVSPTFADFQLYLFQSGEAGGLHECRKPCAKTHVFPCIEGGGNCKDAEKGSYVRVALLILILELLRTWAGFF
jgi:hypothetical protein